MRGGRGIGRDYPSKLPIEQDPTVGLDMGSTSPPKRSQPEQNQESDA